MLKPVTTGRLREFACKCGCGEMIRTNQPGQKYTRSCAARIDKERVRDWKKRAR